MPADLVIPPGPGIPRGLVIPGDELRERYSRSSGPGGQGVNTTDSRVQLTWEPGASRVLSAAQRERVLEGLAHRLQAGVVTIDASEQRSQHQNRAAARERLAHELRAALAPPPPPRRATRPTRGSQQRRLAAKSRRAAVKANRARPSKDS